MVALTLIFTFLIVLLVRKSTEGDIDFFSPMVAIGGYYFISILAGLTMIFTIDPLDLANDLSYQGVYRLSLFGFVAFYIGLFYSNTIYKTCNKQADNDNRPKCHDKIVKSLGYRVCSKLLLVIGMVSAFLFFFRSGTVPLFAADKNEARMLTMEIPGNGYLLYLMTSMNFYFMLEYYRYASNIKHYIGKKRYIFWSIAILIFVTYLLTGSRRFSLFLIIYALMINNYTIEVIKLKKITVAIVFIIMFVIMFEMFRESSQDTTQSLLITIVYRLVIYISNFTKIYELVPTVLPFKHGATYFMDFLTILPGKQLDYQSWLKELTGLTFKGFGIPPTIVGDLYLNWGEIGVYIGMFLIGMMLQLSYIYLILVKRNITNVVLYIIIFEASLKMITSGISAQLLPLVFQAILFASIIVMIKILAVSKIYNVRRKINVA